MRLRCWQSAAQAIEPVREHSVHEILTAYEVVHACGQGIEGVFDTSPQIVEVRQIDGTTFELPHTFARV
jgi:hypothetical protein